MTTWQAVLTICGLALVTLLTRAFFLIPQREVPLLAGCKRDCATRRLPRCSRSSCPKS